jgi:4-hydroxybenzoate polyprenyltransferase/phosphoserine phosphatase
MTNIAHIGGEDGYFPSGSGTYGDLFDAVTPSRPDEILGAALDQPLVLDLDRTLARTDMLFECLAAALARNPLVILFAIFWLMQGKAVLKRRLAQVASLDLDGMPVNEAVVALATREAARGRTIVLATAAEELMAHRIARRFPFITRVFASNGTVNLKGAAKARLLREAFPGGFIYAGDSHADLAIWREASEIVTVGAGGATLKAARALGKPVLAMPGAGLSGAVLRKAIRMKQWAKNALVFAPVALAGLIFDASAWGHALAAFLALSLVASATYLVNDLFDLADDRQHWTKRNRPLASGAMRIEYGLALVPLLALAGFGLAALLGAKVLAVVVLYTVVTLAYSFGIKRVAILDVAMLAGLFTLRLFLGVVAIGVVISPWLFVFSMALFLSLSIAKRHTEVVRAVLHGKTKLAGRGYVARDEPLLLAMGMGAAMSAIVLFALYLSSDAVRRAFYSAPEFLWIAPVALFLWLGRVWLKSQRGELDDDPVAFALRDGPSLALGAMLGLGFLLAAFCGPLTTTLGL